MRNATVNRPLISPRQVSHYYCCVNKARAAASPAAKRRKNAAHSASRGSVELNAPAPKGRKKQQPRSAELRLISIPIPGEIRPGDSIADKLLAAMRKTRLQFQPGDILVVKHKIVSKSEGRLVNLATITPSAESIAWAKQYSLDPRVIELSLRESQSVIRRRNGVLITETHHGFLCANSGVDVSNVDGGKHALLLPEDPDRSAANLRRALKRRTGLNIPVIITDSFGRPWREGLTEFAIGIAGMKPLRDDRGHRDPHGYKLQASVEAVADELACAAGLVCGKLNRAPACIVRGFRYEPGAGTVRDLLRPAKSDLFR
jgi:coenzyme F420-0:L-glutamate ligase / coenzyme F420-1:gamma-L-glutamate ligase